MPRVVSLIDFRPPPRYDGVAFTTARVEEAAASSGPWTALEAFALVPIDLDPTVPLSRDLTTDQAQLDSGWYRVVFVDGAGSEAASGPIQDAPGSAGLWATVEQLRTTASDLKVRLRGDDDACRRLLLRAQGDVEVYGLGGRVRAPGTLTSEQRKALAEAAVRQAVWIAQGDDWLGPDGIAAMGGLTFSRDPRARLSPAALEAIALHDLILRSGTVAPPAAV